ncbi:IS110 family transposase [Neobacillus drentensis]|uniref:IS110 family transposase n=1 Tax=Neobacillus drentensis TaxID=220684 RepID=UPI003F689944
MSKIEIFNNGTIKLFCTIKGVDIAKYKHVARAQDYIGLEFSAPFYFENTNSSFNCFIEWLKKLIVENQMEKVIVGMEPTGHYWLNLAHFLKEQDIKFVYYTKNKVTYIFAMT